jgi:hypothetical protein
MLMEAQGKLFLIKNPNKLQPPNSYSCERFWNILEFIPLNFPEFNSKF